MQTICIKNNYMGFSEHWVAILVCVGGMPD